MGTHKTQGTELYVLDTTVSPPAVLKLAGLTNLDGLGGQASKIDTTTMDNLRFKTNMSGLIDPGSSNSGYLYDMDSAAQEFLHDNAAGLNFEFAAGFSNGYGIPPTVNGSEDGFTLPTNRAWVTFNASISQDAVSWAMDDVVKLAHAFQLSGEYARHAKTT